MRPYYLIYLSILKSNEAVLSLQGKNDFSYRVAHRLPIFNESVCSAYWVLPVYVFTFSHLTARAVCTLPISTNPGPVGSGWLGLTRETCAVVRRFGVVAVAGLLCTVGLVVRL